jgi:hypothetical protein
VHNPNYLYLHVYYYSQDASACFGPVICILSLAAPIAITFIDRESNKANSVHMDNTENTNNTDITDSTHSHYPGAAHASVWLRPRSLTVMSGDARYRYSHGIAARHTDKVSNTMTQ